MSIEYKQPAEIVINPEVPSNTVIAEWDHQNKAPKKDTDFIVLVVDRIGIMYGKFMKNKEGPIIRWKGECDYVKLHSVTFNQ